MYDQRFFQEDVWAANPSVGPSGPHDSGYNDHNGCGKSTVCVYFFFATSVCVSVCVTFLQSAPLSSSTEPEPTHRTSAHMVTTCGIWERFMSVCFGPPPFILKREKKICRWTNRWSTGLLLSMDHRKSLSDSHREALRYSSPLHVCLHEMQEKKNTIRPFIMSTCLSWQGWL